MRNFAILVLVPETAIDEDYRLILAQNQVGRAGQLLIMQPETKALPMQYRAHPFLRASVVTSYSRHNAGTGFLVDTVSQYLTLLVCLWLLANTMTELLSWSV